MFTQKFAGSRQTFRMQKSWSASLLIVTPTEIFRNFQTLLIIHSHHKVSAAMGRTKSSASMNFCLGNCHQIVNKCQQVPNAWRQIYAAETSWNPKWSLVREFCQQQHTIEFFKNRLLPKTRKLLSKKLLYSKTFTVKNPWVYLFQCFTNKPKDLLGLWSSMGSY